MRIEKRTIIVLTNEEGKIFGRAIELLNCIIEKCNDAELKSLAVTAAMELSNFWRDDAVEIE